MIDVLGPERGSGKPASHAVTVAEINRLTPLTQRYYREDREYDEYLWDRIGSRRVIRRVPAPATCRPGPHRVRREVVGPSNGFR